LHVRFFLPPDDQLRLRAPVPRCNTSQACANRMALAVRYRSLPFLVQDAHAGDGLDEIVMDGFMRERTEGDLTHVR
jgi:hypothetical protein